jgi:hypothetical protein
MALQDGKEDVSLNIWIHAYISTSYFHIVRHTCAFAIENIFLFSSQRPMVRKGGDEPSSRNMLRVLVITAISLRSASTGCV